MLNTCLDHLHPDRHNPGVFPVLMDKKITPSEEEMLSIVLEVCSFFFGFTHHFCVLIYSILDLMLLQIQNNWPPPLLTPLRMFKMPSLSSKEPTTRTGLTPWRQPSEVLTFGSFQGLPSLSILLAPLLLTPMLPLMLKLLLYNNGTLQMAVLLAISGSSLSAVSWRRF